MTIQARAQASGISFVDLEPSLESFEHAVLTGLAASPKSIPSKFFYDEAGSRLFEDITTLDEYYPTRTEKRILADNIGEIAGLIGPAAELVEFGAGALDKVRILLDTLVDPAAYVALDISRDFLLTSAQDLASDHPDLDITAVCADYSKPFDLPAAGSGARRRVGFFPGSTIGNFTREEAADFLANAARLLGTGGALLIGVDTRKDQAVLHAAYNDARGITAAFNLNLLARINRELDGDFDLDRFRHDARWNEAAGRVEMHLVSTRAQTVTVAGRPFDFASGETIHTENSYKYRLEAFSDLATAAGWQPRAVWQDADRLFSLHYLEVA